MLWNMHQTPIHYMGQWSHSSLMLSPSHKIQIIEAEWHIYASVSYVTIGSDNGLSTVWCQAII